MKRDMIKGIAVNNPWDIDKDYLLFTIDYAAQMGFDHIQIVGPIHDVVRGNCDGMTPYRKYSQFNNEKNMPYVEYNLDAVNAACDKAAAYGIKTYMWHHELEPPNNFREAYPETLNSYGDIEVTHPIIKDFLENKIIDFFYSYPNMNGLILTLHETKYPLLKLKNQKLDKIERVKYVTQILYNTCKSLGKELIVRPFASVEEDYQMMLNAYEKISTEMLVMDKWTQFDWSLTMPHNAFYKKIQKNPLLVEADIFGEFFGKGHLPLMLKEHIAEKFTYCEGFSPAGYVARIDRDGQIPFGGVNEVNIVIMNAYLAGKNVEEEISGFFHKRYGTVATDVMALMECTERVLKKTIYTKGYYYTELSRFPSLNHSKNHFYFEMLREQFDITSDEWFIPHGWKRESVEALLAEKQDAVREADKLYDRILQLRDTMDEKEFHKLLIKFTNLKLVTKIWEQLFVTFWDYVRYFETFDDTFATSFEKDVELLCSLKQRGVDILGDAFYCLNGGREPFDYVEAFAKDIRESFAAEGRALKMLVQDDSLTDFIVCGGAMEGHRLKKEVNFSDTLVIDGNLCRIPGNRKGMAWSNINAHGWFSYELKVRPKAENQISLLLGNPEGKLEARITIGDKEYEICEQFSGRKEYRFPYTPQRESDRVRVRVDKISRNTPCVYIIKSL